MAFPVSTEIAACPLCGCGDNQPYLFEHPACFSGEVELGLNRCGRCSLQYISPRLNPDGLTYLYDVVYLEDTVSGVNTADPRTHQKDYDAFYSRVTRCLPGGGKLLDAGCGVGHFLRRFPQGGLFEVEGIDSSAYAVEAAMKSGLNVARGDFSQWRHMQNRYDCVVLLSVLEHLAHPKAALQKVLTILRPGGYLMIAVPNYRYLKIVADNPVARLLRRNPSPLHSEEHLQNFTPATLERMVTDSGFTIREWGCAEPLNIGSRAVVCAKRAANLVVQLLFRMGYHLGGIHLVAQRPAS